jgi:hypothetical protein
VSAFPAACRAKLSFAAGIENELKKILLSTEDSLQLAAGNLQKINR